MTVSSAYIPFGGVEEVRDCKFIVKESSNIYAELLKNENEMKLTINKF